MKLWHKIAIGLVLGVLAGIIFGPRAAIVAPLGTLFLNAIKMLIVPLVFSSLVVGVTSAKDIREMGRIGIKTIVLYLLTTAFAVTIGLGFGLLFQPGTGLSLEATAAGTATAVKSPSLVETLLDIIPQNPVAALATGNILQTILFAIVLGVAIVLTGKKAEPVKAFFEAFAEVMYKLTSLVMKLAPLGVFALIATTTANYGLDILLPLGKVIVALYLGCIVHSVVILGGLLFLLARLNPLSFFRDIVDAQLVAFTTTSSSGTLPVSMKCAEDKLGVSKSVSSFVLPLGATINMDGTALYQGISALFVAQLFSIDLSFSQYMTIILTATLASIGTAGVPGGGLIMLSLILNSVGLPLEGIALVAGIDRILDMARTTVNVTGDLAVTAIVAKSENELNKGIYDNRHTFTDEETSQPHRKHYSTTPAKKPAVKTKKP